MIPRHFTLEQWSEFLTEITAYHFLPQDRGLWITGVEGLTAEQWTQLNKSLSCKAPRLTICLEGSQVSSAFLDRVRPTCEVMELKELKPGELKHAHIQECIRLFHAQEKKITPKQAQKFVEWVDRIGGGLAVEVEKWVCYLGDRVEVTDSDLDVWIHHAPTHTLWDLFDAICERRVADALQHIDSLSRAEVAPQAIIASLRTQTQQHLKIMALIPEGPAAVQKAFPYLKGHLYDRKVRLLQKDGLNRLTALLGPLFVAESRLREVSVYPEYPLERFIFESDL